MGRTNQGRVRFYAMKHTQRYTLLVAALVIASLLAACGGGEQAPTAGSRDAGAGSDAGRVATEPDGGAAGDEAGSDTAGTEAGILEADYSSLEHQGYSLQWRVNGDMLDVVLSYETTGWISVGFDPSRMMQDANIIIGYVTDGTATVSDQYGTGQTAHQPDTEIGGADSLVNASGVEEKGYTEISFSMPLDSGEDSDRPLEPGSTYTVLLGHGPDGADDFTTYHAGRTSVEIEI